MWLNSNKIAAGPEGPANNARQHLLIARAGMEDALRLLDLHSMSAAAATLDMAIHMLDRELSSAPDEDEA